MSFLSSRNLNESQPCESKFTGNLRGEEFTEYLHQQQIAQEEAQQRSKSMTWTDRTFQVSANVRRRKTWASFYPSESVNTKHELSLGQQRCSEQALHRLILSCPQEDFRNFKESVKSTGVITSMGASQVLHAPLRCHILRNLGRSRRRGDVGKKSAFSAAA